ncbi:MAG: hypothetical protein ACXAC5_11055 [Promethearchaeota archaeon]|jgi:hypothetical protein
MNKNTVLWSILIVAILVTFIFDQMLAIWITVALLSIALIIYLISLSFQKKLIRTMEKHLRIIDMDIAVELNQSIEKIRKTLIKLHKHQKQRRGLIIFLNNRYIFYNRVSVNKLLKLFGNGLKEKEVLEQLKETIGLKTRAEVKVIKDTLVDHKKIEKSDSKIKHKDQLRKSEIY